MPQNHSASTVPAHWTLLEVQGDWEQACCHVPLPPIHADPGVVSSGKDYDPDWHWAGVFFAFLLVRDPPQMTKARSLKS